ncbi:DNA transformation protein [Nitrospirillum amazonense]|uniref:DNA transformation protein n=1 Tax=Nitrospirillum amazonense TaxID=28077 RepID=A0A560JQY5_9PROT|nr:TfoX/Sxy family protein [Nitrospirillum amazonense]TWB73347.1 DNA transformation protein [Nitrospirillum amazonense]
MPVSPDFLDYILDLLAPLSNEYGGSVEAPRLFGGRGLTLHGRNFGLITRDDTLYLKADAISQPQFEAAGCIRFAPWADKPHRSLGYYTPPEGAMDDPDELLRWARLAVDAALRAPAKAPKKAKAPAAAKRKNLADMLLE